MKEKNNLILILHGWGSCSKNWQEVKNYLEGENFKVFIPDLPGFGLEPPPKKIWLIDDYVEWVQEYCKKNEIINFFLVGHSFGGAIATKFSLRYPDKVKKLFLVAPALVRKKNLIKKIISRLSKIFSFLPFKIKRIIYNRFLKSDYCQSSGIMREIFKKIIENDLTCFLEGIKIPTIIIWGKKDNVTPVKDAYLIHKKINNSKLIIIEGQNHNLNRKAPDILAKKILENI